MIPGGESNLEKWLEFRNGRTSPKRDDSANVPVFGSNGVIGYTAEPLVKTPSIVIGRVGSYCGSLYYSSGHAWVTDNAIYAQAKSSEETQFWYYALQTLDLNSRSHGSGQPLLNQSVLNSITFKAPAKELRLQTATALGALDNKIDSNSRSIAIIENLGAAMLSKELGEASLSTKYCLGDFIEILETGNRPKGGATKHGIVSLGAESIKSAGVGGMNEVKYVPEDFAQAMKRGHLLDGDVLVYKDGAALRSGASIISAFGYGFPTKTAVINEHVFRVRAHKSVSQGLLYWLLKTRLVDNEIRSRVTGAAQPGLNASSFRSVGVPDNLNSVGEKLNSSLDLLLRATLTLGAENLKLAETRRALLPGLISGRLSLSVDGAW